MPFTKTTARAFAASIAFVVAGATLAGAAVFHLPVLGFSSASASAAPAPVRKVLATHKVAPRKIVRIRYVDDVVHRPAPVSAYAAAPVAVTLSAPAAPRRRGPVVATSRAATAVAPRASGARYVPRRFTTGPRGRRSRPTRRSRLDVCDGDRNGAD